MTTPEYKKILAKLKKEKNILFNQIKLINLSYINLCKKYNNSVDNFCNLNQEQLIFKMKDIMHDNEQVPDNDNWIQIDNYYKHTDFSLEYSIDQLLINKIKEYNSLYNTYVSKGYDKDKIFKYKDSKYLKIFIVYDPNDKKNFVPFYTSCSVLNVLKRNISIYLNERKNSPFDRFINLNDLHVKLFAIYKGITSRDSTIAKKLRDDLIFEFIKKNNIKMEKKINEVDKVIQSNLTINLSPNKYIKNLVESYKGLNSNNIIFKIFDEIYVTTQIPFKLQNINKKFVEPSYGLQYGKIYLIYDNNYNHFYFGSTMCPMSVRLSDHKKTILGNERYYAKIINNLGINKFFCIIVEYVDTIDHIELKKREDYYIKKYNAKDKSIGGMNIVDADFLTKQHYIRKSYRTKKNKYIK